jgi:hypothetical protein
VTQEVGSTIVAVSVGYALARLLRFLLALFADFRKLDRRPCSTAPAPPPRKVGGAVRFDDVFRASPSLGSPCGGWAPGYTLSRTVGELPKAGTVNIDERPNED